MASAVPQSSRTAWSQGRGAARAAAYRLHVLVGLVLSLGVVTAAFRVPWGNGPTLVGWGASQVEAFEATFEETGARPETEETIRSLYRIVPAEGEASARIEEEPPAEPAAVELPDASASQLELERLPPILEFAEEAPVLVGGLGSLYLHIRYPQAAIERGIQGRVVLKFVVEPDGRTSEIVVEKGLHPLCDSAAVQALRAVAFVPGRQNGEAARVRMRLPVRFQLVRPDGEPVSDSSLASAG